jgi:serine/threonine protein kinase/Tfp pilus assembly protein PilF
VTRFPAPDRWRLIAPILEEALDLPPERRSAYLDRACGGDTGLRAEIEALLNADTEAGAFLDAPVDLSALGPLPDTPAVAGTTIGPYRVVREIGRGGMGVVYEAEQQRPRRPVALKVILGGRHVDAEAVRMFQRETDSLARLKHPSIAAIYESGSTEEGQHFFAMELVQGRSLSEFLDEKGAARSRADVRLRLDLFRKICAAVAYAHQRGVIHLDLKPSNILVLETPGVAVPEIKVLDFGLARITDPDAGGATAVTAFGRIQGTLPYMSPEQIRGRRDEVDVRSDVYALGVILYRLLAGRLPYDLDGREITEAARIVCEEPPRPLGSAADGAARFDHDLTVVALKTLEKEPARRYAGVAALDEDVARYLDGRPILARPPSAAYQIRKLVTRHRVPFAAAAALLVLLVGFAVAMALQARRIAAERDRASREATTALRVSDFLTDLFKVSSPNEARGNAITAREILDKGVEKIGSELADEPEIQARLMLTMGNVYSSLGLYKKATPLLEKSLEMRRRLLGEDNPDTLEAMDDLAFWYEMQGRASEAETIYARLLEARRRLLGEDNPDTLEAMYGLAGTYRDERRFSEEETLRRQALETKRRTLGEDNPGTLMSMVALANSYASQSRYADAETLYRQALERIRRVMGNDNPHTLGTMRILANLYRAQGRHAEAERLYRETLDGERRVLGEDHPQTLAATNDFAALFKDQGRYTESSALYREALRRERRVLGEDHPDTANTLYSLGCLSALRGSRVEALDWLGQAVAHGYAHADTMAGDSDLRRLRGDPAFESLVARARKNSGA